MASSQVEIAPSSPFGFALRDHNRHDRWRDRDSNAFRKNFKDFVHCISGQPGNTGSDSNENSHDHINPSDLWVHIQTHTINKTDHAKNHAGGKWARAREMVFSGDAKRQNHGSSAPVTPLQRENSPDQSESSVQIPNLGGVSSLVRKWRDFEAEAKSSNPNTSNNSPVCISRTNSVSNLVENASTEIAQRGSDAGDHESVDGKYETRSTNEDSSGDWESDRTSLSGPPSSRGRDSDATEKERLRVADIIRKLTSSTEENNNDREHAVGNESSPCFRASLNQSEQRPFSPVLGSPRLRGRQAFRDLLMKAERDRHKELEGLVERKAVSRFSQRGRIQAMLRAQFLRGAAEVKDGRPLNCTSSKSDRLTQSAILHIRERFKTGSQHVAIDSRNPHTEVVDYTQQVEKPFTSNQSSKDNHQEEVTESMCLSKEVADDIQHAESSCKSNEVDVDISHHETKTTLEQCSFQAPTSENVDQEASPRLDVTEQRESNEIRSHGLLQSVEETFSFNDIKEDGYADEQDGNGQQLTITTSNRAIHNADPKGGEQLSETSYNSSDGAHPPGDLEEGANNQYLTESDHGWVSDASHTQIGWEELHSDYEGLAETSEDWITDISRPRSEWEGLRQERYQEMLDPFQENEEIRQLLQRRSVSSFLSGNTRERIDRLMISRTPQQPNQMVIQTEEDEEQVAGEEEEERAPGDVEREAEQEEEDEEEEDEGNAGYDDDYEENNESEDYADQTTSSLPLTTWSHNNGPDVSDDSDQLASPSLQQNTSSNSYSPESRTCSSFSNHSSIEMELIYELRGHMEQLHQEISELRKSLKSCTNMQRKLQRSVKQEAAAAALGQAGQRKGRHSTQNKGRSKGNCCICHEVQVDSLLYRCGHMCTCFKCAHELQWNSGRCPICRAPIIDVVRAYPHSSSTEMKESLFWRTDILKSNLVLNES